jgi:multidrug efflux system outer membrane protein
MVSTPVLAVLVLSSCTVGPNYQRPKVNSPPSFRGAQGAARNVSLADLPWWDVFKDGTLKELIKTALANNYDVAIAATRVEQARQILAQERSHYYPAFDYQGRLVDGRNQLMTNPSTAGGTQGLLLAIATASWEADVWGRIRRLNQAAKAQYLSSEEARRGVMLTLVSDVSSAYLQLLGLRLKSEIAAESADAFSQTRTLFTQREEGGISSMLPVDRASASEATSASQVIEYQRQIALTEDALSVLLGQNPHSISTRS